MEQKEIEEKLGKVEEELKQISQHLKVPEKKTLPQILQSIDTKFTDFDKRLTNLEQRLERQEWTTEYINDLPDSAFAVIALGGEKDEQGKTVPRTLRKLPHHNKEGDLNLGHLRNALARVNQIEPANLLPEAKKHLCAHARSEKAEDLVSEFCGEEPPAEGGVEQKLGRAIIVPQEPEETKESLKNVSLREVMEES